MKKLFAYVIAMSLAGSATAASIGFDFGTNFYKPSAAGYTTENGQNFSVSWNLDSDISFGVYNEQSNVVGPTAVVSVGTLDVSALEVSKGVMKNVSVGLRLGSATFTDTTTPTALSNTSTFVDILGTVTILSASGDKVEGSLRASAAARFSRVDLNSAATYASADGVNLGLSVQVAF